MKYKAKKKRLEARVDDYERMINAAPAAHKEWMSRAFTKPGSLSK